MREIIDCHYCRYACCGSPEEEDIRCCCDDGCYFDHYVKDSKKEAEECSLFEFDDYFPKY